MINKKSFEEGKLRKDASTSSLHKKDEKYLPCNYKIISLTSIIYEILESFIKSDFMLYICDNHFLVNSQYEHLSERTCQFILLVMVNCQTEAIDKGLCTDIIYLDFAKISDSVLHKKVDMSLDMALPAI